MTTQKIDLKNGRWGVFGNTLYIGTKKGDWIAFPGDAETAYRLAEAHNAALEAENKRLRDACVFALTYLENGWPVDEVEQALRAALAPEEEQP